MRVARHLVHHAKLVTTAWRDQMPRSTVQQAPTHLKVKNNAQHVLKALTVLFKQKHPSNVLGVRLAHQEPQYVHSAQLVITVNRAVLVQSHVHSAVMQLRDNLSAQLAHLVSFALKAHPHQ